MKLYALQTIDSSIYICDNESYQINIVYLNRLYRNVYLKNIFIIVKECISNISKY